MSDARWSEIAADFDGAAGHFRNAVALYELGGFEAPGLDGYRARMAFMHSMQVAHTSLESGLIRILELIGEEKPGGEQWHADLIRRAGMERPGVRPAILGAGLAAAANRTRRFRHVAVRGYDSFEPEEAEGAVEAARKLAAGLSAVLEAFREALDPD